VTGAEPDLTELTIPLPTARASSTYLVYWAKQSVALLFDASFTNASKTTTQFVASLSGPASAGDVLAFHVEDSF